MELKKQEQKDDIDNVGWWNEKQIKGEISCRVHKQEEGVGGGGGGA